MRRFCALVLAVLVAAVAVATLSAAPAGAHAFLTSSNPADGSSLRHAPRLMTLDFSESVVVEATRVDIVDGAGKHLPSIAIRLVGQAAADTELPTRLAVALPALKRSTYTVSWRTVSSDDLHATSGVFAFGIGEAVRAAAFAEPAPHLDEAALRWGVFVAMALAVGAAVWSRLAGRATGALTDRDLKRSRRLGLAGAAGGAGVAVLLLVDQSQASRSSLQTLIDSGYALRWSVREAGLVLLAGALLVRPGGTNRVRGGVLVAGTAASALGSALLGHSATGGITRVGADALHLSATAVWAGTLMHALVALIGLRGRVHPVARVLRHFRVPALTAVAVMVTTGVYLAGGVVGSVDAALRTNYGHVLLIKLALVGAAFALGALNSVRLRARRSVLRARTLVGEAVAALVVLGIAAVLTAGQPALESHFVTASGPVPVAVRSATVADLAQSIALRPNRPGASSAIVSVFDTRRPSPAPVTGVLVDAGAGVVRAQLLQVGTWTAPIRLEAPGPVAVVVTVLRAGRRPVRHVYRWVVGADQSRTVPAMVSTAPLVGPLSAAALVLAALAIWGFGLAVLSARRRGGARQPARTPTPEPDRPAVLASSVAGTGPEPAGGAVDRMP